MIATQQTLEVIAALRALSLRHQANLADDGRESRWEMLGYFHEVPAIKLAIQGIKDVPLELANLSSDEVPAIAQGVSDILGAWGVSHRSQDITAEVLRDIVDSIPVFQEAARRWQVISSMPPTAIAVP